MITPKIMIRLDLDDISKPPPEGGIIYGAAFSLRYVNKTLLDALRELSHSG